MQQQHTTISHPSTSHRVVLLLERRLFRWFVSQSLSFRFLAAESLCQWLAGWLTACRCESLMKTTFLLLLTIIASGCSIRKSKKIALAAVASSFSSSFITRHLLALSSIRPLILPPPHRPLFRLLPVQFLLRNFQLLSQQKKVKWKLGFQLKGDENHVTPFTRTHCRQDEKSRNHQQSKWFLQLISKRERTFATCIPKGTELTTDTGNNLALECPGYKTSNNNDECVEVKWWVEWEFNLKFSSNWYSEIFASGSFFFYSTPDADAAAHAAT